MTTKRKPKIDPDVIPVFCQMTQAQRDAVWAKNPPRPVQQQMTREVFVPIALPPRPDRIARMQSGKIRKKVNEEMNLIPPAFRRWDCRRSRFVDEREDDARRLKKAAERLGITLEVEMKLTIAPYLEGQELPSERGKTSIKASSAEWEVQNKIRQAAWRVGRKLQRIEVINHEGSLLHTWTVDESKNVLHNGDATIDLTAKPEETDVAKTKTKPKAKSTKKAAKAKAPKKEKAEKGYKGHRAGSRKEKAHELFDKIGPEKARPKVLELGIKPGTISSWFSAFAK